MPSKEGLRLSPTTARDGLFFNAFEDPEPTSTTSSSPDFLTTTWQEEVMKAPRRAKPTLRRRGSETTLNSPGQNGGLRVSARPLGHSRSQTEQGGNSLSYHPHPLGSTSFSPDAFASHSGSTRPHLSRIMSAWESPADSDPEGDTKASSSNAGSVDDTQTVKDDEKMVLVHEVSLWLFLHYMR
jgi:hypothetical protein